MLAHLRLVGAHGELQLHLVGDDVVAGAAGDRADRDHGGIARAVLAGHDGLQRQHGAGCQHDGIHRLLGMGAVAALSEDGDVHGVDVGGRVAGNDLDLSRGQVGCVVDGEHEVRLGEALPQPGVDHRARSPDGLLRRLAHHDQRAAPSILALREERRRRHPGGHVHVVAAGVHDVDLLPRVVDRGDRARVGQAGLLFHRERVELGAQRDRRAGPVAQHSDHAGAAHAGRYLEAELAQALRHLGGGVHLVARQLGRLVQVEIELVHLWVEAIDGGRLCRSGRGERPGKKRDPVVDRHGDSSFMKAARRARADRGAPALAAARPAGRRGSSRGQAPRW